MGRLFLIIMAIYLTALIVAFVLSILLRWLLSSFIATIVAPLGRPRRLGKLARSLMTQKACEARYTSSATSATMLNSIAAPMPRVPMELNSDLPSWGFRQCGMDTSRCDRLLRKTLRREWHFRDVEQNGTAWEPL
jgi:hypothetical protein